MRTHCDADALLIREKTGRKIGFDRILLGAKAFIYRAF
jgi:hypothetical protein